MKVKSILVAFLFFALGTAVVYGQNTLKIGYTNPEYILSLMPKYKQVESDLKAYEKQLQAQLDKKLKEYQAKLEKYQQDVTNASIPDVVKQDTEKDLIAMQNNIKDFEQNAMADMQKRQNQALEPIIDEVQKAIDAVAEENGFTYVFSTAAGADAIILYAKNKNEDISELVLKKMGITVPTNTESGSTNGTTTDPSKTTTPTGTGNTNTNTNTGTPLKKK